MPIDLTWFTKNSKNKGILAILITLLFCFLHMLLWVCIYYRLGSIAATQFSDPIQVEASRVIVNLATVGFLADSVCLIVSIFALYGIRKDFEGRHYLYTWIFGMILYILFASLTSWCFSYWIYKKEMIQFILITSIFFWFGRTSVLIGCLVQVSSHFMTLMRPADVPSIIIQEAPVLRPGAPKGRNPSVSTIATTVSNMSNPDAICEKQYPGYLPYSIDFDTMYPSYLFDDYDPTMYPPENFGYDYYQYIDEPQHLVSPSYEEATSSTAHNPPPYSTADSFNPPSYSETDQNLGTSVQTVDSTPGSELLYPAARGRNDHIG